MLLLLAWCLAGWRDAQSGVDAGGFDSSRFVPLTKTTTHRSRPQQKSRSRPFAFASRCSSLLCAAAGSLTYNTAQQYTTTSSSRAAVQQEELFQVVEQQQLLLCDLWCCQLRVASYVLTFLGWMALRRCLCQARWELRRA